MASRPISQLPHPIPQISSLTNPQTSSPLFSALPAEIRQRIYELALHHSPDPSQAYNRQHMHYRPGHQNQPKYDFNLLQTCKRIYHEARLLPVSANEITIYLYRGPRPKIPSSNSQHNWRLKYKVLNADQRRAVHTVHIFAQQYYLESAPALSQPQHPWFEAKRCLGAIANTEIKTMSAKKLILTLRRSDWWTWDAPVMSSDQLGICPWRHGRTDWRQMEEEPWEGPLDGKWRGWGDQFRHVCGLEVLEMEFEAVEAKRSQLERVVERAKHWRFPLDDHDRILAWTGVVKESTWLGAVDLKEDHGDRPVRLRSVHAAEADAPIRTCPYLVMTMNWRVARRKKAI